MTTSIKSSHACAVDIRTTRDSQISQYKWALKRVHRGYSRHAILAASMLALLSHAPARAADKAYPSDTFTGEGFVSMFAGWDAITKNRPDTIAENLRKVIDINQDATLDERKHALTDQYDDMAKTIGEGLGNRLGQIYIKAYTDGQLPKTKALLNKESGRAAGKNASSNPSKDHYDFPRPYLVSDRIYRFDNPEGDAYGSKSGAFPSGHTSQAYWQGTLLATMVPERFDEILARTAQAGHNRLIMGVHYPLDVVGGRMMGQRIAAFRWSDAEFRPLILEAAQELRDVLEKECGASLEVCIATDTPYLSSGEAARQYDERMTYGFDAMGKTDRDMEVPAGAENMLTTRFPYLTPEQRKDVLKTTALASGFPLDIKGDEGGWQRLNLSAAGRGYGSISGNVAITLDPAAAQTHAPGSAYNALDVWTNDIGGNGILTKLGQGSLKLTGNNAFGGLVIDGGAVELAAVNSFEDTVDVKSGSLDIAQSLSAKTIKVAEGATASTSGVVNAETAINGTLLARGAHLVGKTLIYKEATLELGGVSASQPSLIIDGKNAALALNGTISIDFAPDVTLCPGTVFKAAVARHGAKMDGTITRVRPSPALTESSLAYEAEIKDGELLITLTGKGRGGC